MCRKANKKIINQLTAMAHSAEYGLALWATAQNFFKRYGPWRRITANSWKSLPQPLKEQ